MSREAGEHISRASFRQGKGPMSRTWPVLIAFSRENEVPGLPGTSLPVLPIAEESALGGGVARKLSLGQKAFCPFFFPFIQQIFTKEQLYAKHCAGHWEPLVNTDTDSHCPCRTFHLEMEIGSLFK